MNNLYPLTSFRDGKQKRYKDAIWIILALFIIALIPNISINNNQPVFISSNQTIGGFGQYSTINLTQIGYEPGMKTNIRFYSDIETNISLSIYLNGENIYTSDNFKLNQTLIFDFDDDVPILFIEKNRRINHLIWFDGFYVD